MQNISPFNNYDRMVELYALTHTKADKRYSTWPTIQLMSGDLSEKIVLDAGCGDGFFSQLLRDHGAKQVIGWDISSPQVEKARSLHQDTLDLTFEVKDLFADPLPRIDIINAPYILNYAPDIESLRQLIGRLASSLNPNGKIIGVIDLPSGRDLRKYGANKRLLGPSVDGTGIEITVFDKNGDPISILPSIVHFYRKETFERLLAEVGLDCIWYPPAISAEGLAVYGQSFWNGYLEDPELGYFIAQKR